MAKRLLCSPWPRSSRAVARSRHPTPPPSAPDGGDGDARRERSAESRGGAALPLWPKLKKGTLPERPHLLRAASTTSPRSARCCGSRSTRARCRRTTISAGSRTSSSTWRSTGRKRFPKHEHHQLPREDRHAVRRRPQRVHELRRDRLPARGPDRQRRSSSARASTSCATGRGDITFDPAEVEKERGVVLEEWRLGRGARHAPVRQAGRRCCSRASRYAERLPIGMPEILKSAPRDTLVRYYKDWYRPDLMAVIAVGDFDPAAIEKEIKARSSAISRTRRSRASARTAGVPKAEGTRVSIETDKRAADARSSRSTTCSPHRPESTAKRLPPHRRRAALRRDRQRAARARSRAARTRRSRRARVGVQGDRRARSTRSRASRRSKGGKVEDALRALFTEVLRVEKHGFTQTELDRARTVHRAQRRAERRRRGDRATAATYTDEITRNFFEGEFMIGRKAERDFTLKFLPTITRRRAQRAREDRSAAPTTA